MTNKVHPLMVASTTIQVEASKYAIKAVTIFKSSKAEIVRAFHLDLKVFALLCLSPGRWLTFDFRKGRTKFKYVACRALLIPVLFASPGSAMRASSTSSVSSAKGSQSNIPVAHQR